MSLTILAAAPDAITWQTERDNAVSTPMPMVAAALIDATCDRDQIANLAGHDVHEHELVMLMDAMRAADGVTRCACGSWVKDAVLCDSCTWDTRLEEWKERAADFDSNWDRS